MRTVETVQDIQDMARGAVLLGTGGGGDPYVGELFLLAQLKKGKTAVIVDASEVDDDAFVLSIAGVGAPPVLVEHLVSDKLLLKLLARAEAFYGRRVDALISAEIGGANSMFPLALSAILDFGEVSLAFLSDLRVGEVLVSDLDLHAPLTVQVEGHGDIAAARLHRRQDRRAVVLHAPLQPTS